MELIHVGLSLRKLGFIEPGYKAHDRKEGSYGGVNLYCKYWEHGTGSDSY